MLLLKVPQILGKQFRTFTSTQRFYNPLRIAIIGQSLFGAEVYKNLAKKGHSIVGVFTVPDINGRADPLAQAAVENGTPVFKYKRWRVKGKVIPEILSEYSNVGADLNVLPFCSQFIPMDVINKPRLSSIIYHPSLLPKHRGASAINWTLINGDPKAGFTIFWADDGLDTGPILLQKECDMDINDNVDSLYNRFLYPEGIKGMVEAVDLIADGQAPTVVQPEEGASYDPILKRETARIDWNQPAVNLHNFIRGNDKVPGAWGILDEQEVTFYGSRLWESDAPSGSEVTIEGVPPGDAILHAEGLLIRGSDGKMINVSQLRLDGTGKMIPAHRYGVTEEEAQVGQMSTEEKEMEPQIKEIWEGILSQEVNQDTDFFKCGAGSMDVTRLVEAINQMYITNLNNEDVYMATTFDSFFKMVILRKRNGGEEEFVYDAVQKKVNGIDISFPHQLFINNKFVDSVSGKTFKTIDPTSESVICDVALGNAEDVHKAVVVAKNAFENGEWGKMNARDRGKLIYRLADLMEENKYELATLESIDSGAVFSLAIKTHVGMSIDTFRYFAGWCDKIHGSVIPINHARPNRNLTITKREPIGVCGIITPWNYPLMMLAWKTAACLAAGNTLVLKPAQVTPLTSLKFCELVALAGFPPGVVNVIPGAGSVVGQAIADHPDIRKLGFTGSTPIGKTIMESCAKSNLKKVSLELGGKSPLIIFADCDMEKAVRMGCSAVFFNKGENCIAAGRIFVEESIAEEYVSRVVDEVKKMRIGDPLDRDTDHGPQNHKAHLDKLVEFCDIGVKEGAKLVYGGKRLDRQGLFMYPTVFTDVKDTMSIAKEESFGPIMIISTFTDVDEVVARANASEFGLAGGVFTKDVGKALRVAERIQGGSIFINTYNKTDVAVPFGGFKQSGFGKDLGEEALHEYTKTKSITLEY